jgi:transcriptional regulator with XRE-family HTH domain
MDIKGIFGKNLKQIRDKFDISQEKMGEICGGLSERMIREMERGNRFPSSTSMDKILKGLNDKGMKIKPYELFLTEDDLEKFNKSQLLQHLRKKLHEDLDRRIDECILLSH